MYRRVSSPKKLTSLSPSDQTRRDTVLPLLKTINEVSLQTIDSAAYANQHRITTTLDPITRSRLTQRNTDLADIKAYFETHDDVTFLGFVGWGDFCTFKLPPKQGFSQTDSIVYRTQDGKVVIEKIGSCFELFGSADSAINPSTPNKLTLPSITSSGKTVTTFAKKPPTAKQHPTSNIMYCGNDPSTLNLMHLTASKRRTKKSDIAHNPLTCSDLNCTDRLLAEFWQAPIDQRSDSQSEVDDSTPVIESNESDRLLPPRTQTEAVVTGEEGCPCCMNAIDLDELAGIAKVASGVDAPYGTPSKLDSHWAVATGLGAPFAALGLVASYRNIKGALSTRSELQSVLAKLDQIPVADRTTQWHAARQTLAYSYFDTHWNLLVPGGLNGISSAAVLTGLAISSPVALPALGLYGAAQTGRNGYDLARNWRRLINHDKIDQITVSKRKFYSANTVGFACVTAGAVLTAIAPATFGATLIPGIILLAYGTTSTGLINNIWPKKFRPRNGDLGINRSCITLEIAKDRIKAIAKEKKAIKAFRAQYMPISTGTHLNLIGAKLLATLPGCDELAQRRIHGIRNRHLTKHSDTIRAHQNELFNKIRNDAGLAIDEIVTGRLKTLRYQQYGLVDFYWALNGHQNGSTAK